MDLEAALRELADALASGERARGRDAQLRQARRVVVDRCVAELGLKPVAPVAIAEAIRLAIQSPSRPAKRACAALVVHALAVRGLVPPALAADVCTLVERALRDVLLRCGYSFTAPLDEKLRVLERLHLRLNDLMQPLEPTFPNWQGLYAG